MSAEVAIIKYNAGNIGSVANALKRLGVDAIVTDSFNEIRSAKKVIFPGVGEASTTMKYLAERGLDKLITSLDQPLLGICLGMQLMCSHSEEGNTKGLGIFKERVKLFKIGAKVPHMGWNEIEINQDKLLSGLPEISHFYFVHSYYCETGPNTRSECNYEIPFSAYLQKDNFYAVQFHPEKSGALGSVLLQNFINL